MKFRSVTYLVTLMGLSVGYAPRASSTVLHVPTDFASVQAAVGAAASWGDTILVAAGSYNEDVTITAKAIAIMAASGNALTSLGSVYWSESGHGSTCTLKGFTITSSLFAVHILGDFAVDECVVCGATTVSSISDAFDWYFIKTNLSEFRGPVDLSLGGESATLDVRNCMFIQADLAANGYGTMNIVDCRFASAGMECDVGRSCLIQGNVLDSGSGISCSLRWDAFVHIADNTVRNTPTGIAIHNSNSTNTARIERNTLSGCGTGFETDDGTGPGSLYVSRNEIARGGCGIYIGWKDGSDVVLSDNTIWNCTDGIDAGFNYQMVIDVHGNTIVGCSGNGIRCTRMFPEEPGPVEIVKNIVVECGVGVRVAETIPELTVGCNDVWHNPGGGWYGIVDPTGTYGNIARDPLFCDRTQWDYHLCADSPCLPGNHPDGVDCGVIGALPQGCGAVAGMAEAVSENGSESGQRILSVRPNPTAGAVSLELALPKAMAVDAAIFDVSGRLVRQLVDADRPAGIFHAIWDGKDNGGREMPTGVYLVRVTTGEGAVTGRLLLIR